MGIWVMLAILFVVLGLVGKFIFTFINRAKLLDS